MSANRIFLVCSHHPSLEDALLIAERAPNSIDYDPVDGKAFEQRAGAWFEKHSACGKPDDFRLAMHRPPNHDVPAELPQPNAVNSGVKLAILEGGLGEAHAKNLNGSKPS